MKGGAVVVFLVFHHRWHSIKRQGILRQRTENWGLEEKKSQIRERNSGVTLRFFSNQCYKNVRPYTFKMAPLGTRYKKLESKRNGKGLASF